MRGNGLWIALAVLGGGLLLLVLNDSSGETLGLDNDRFARLLYMGVLAGVVAAGIIASRRHLGDVVRNLGLWVLVILVLVTGYQYRYELQDVASRVTAGLVPGSPLALGEDDGRATVTLEKAPNGHFEARVLFNGEPVHTVVDTGATTTVLTARDARQAGYDIASLNFSIPVSTANGTARAARVTARDIVIGGIERRNVPVLVAEDGRLQQSLLGMNFIGSLSGFDVRGNRLTLRD